MFRLLDHENGIALKAQETTTIPMWIQAPYQSGEFNLRSLFYYGFKSDTNKMIKFRLVRHSWKFNIHKCLQMGVTCAVSNMQNRDLGLNVSIKNENETHHPLMAEIYINYLALYCAHYKVDQNKMFGKFCC